MGIQKTHFELVKLTFVPDWEVVGPKRLANRAGKSTGWRVVPNIENPIEVIGEYLRRKVGRPSKPVICSMLDASGEKHEPFSSVATLVPITRHFHLHAHDGYSHTWNPCLIGQIEVSLVLHPQWEVCDRCAEVRHVLDVDPCACKIEALAHAVAGRIPYSGAANDSGPMKVSE